MLLPGEISTAIAVEKSAEAIVGFGNEPRVLGEDSPIS